MPVSAILNKQTWQSSVQPAAAIGKVVFLEISHTLLSFKAIAHKRSTTPALAWILLAHIGWFQSCHTSTHCPLKGISLLPDLQVLSASRSTNSWPRFTSFSLYFCFGLDSPLEIRTRLFGVLCLGVLCAVCFCFVLWFGALFWCLARISSVSLFNSIKVTCASRHTKRLHPCKKKMCKVATRSFSHSASTRAKNFEGQQWWCHQHSLLQLRHAGFGVTQRWGPWQKKCTEVDRPM